MDIKKGDWIRVPKGTLLVNDYSGKHSYKHCQTSTTREVVVQVTSVGRDSNWYRHLTPDQTKEWRENCVWHSTVLDRKPESYYIELAKQNAGHKFDIVSWLNDKKAAYAHQVEATEAPAPKKKAEPKVNKRQQMVVKSRWKFTQDHDLVFELDNPEYIKLHDAFYKTYQHPGKHWVYVQTTKGVAQVRVEDLPADLRAKYDAKVAEYDTAFAAYRESIKDVPRHLPKVIRSIKAGEVFAVIGKFQTYNPYGYSLPEIGQVVPVMFDGDADKVFLPYKQVVDVIEADTIPMVNIYVLRQKSTGLFYKGDTYANGWKPEWVEGFMKAKHYDSIGRAKTSILMSAGYFNGLPGADEALPEWSASSGNLQITDDHELVHFDKLGRKEVGPVADFQEWYKRSWELRALTVKYGSSVRTAYKALEKANMLDSQKGMIVFTVTDEEKLEDVGYWGERSALSDEDKAEIELSIASMKKGTFKKAVDHKSMAVSFPNKRDALMFKLSYQGNLKITVLDLEEMKEAVDG